jgi:hypothetical protein
MATTLSRPTELLQRAWARFKSRWGSTLIISLLTSLLYLGVFALIASGVVAVGPDLSIGTALGAGIVSAILITLAGTYFTSMMTVLISDEQPISLGQTAARTNKVYLAVLVTNIVTGLVVGGSTILLIVPGLIMAVYLSLTQVIAVNEGLRGMPALRRSRAMINGQWGQVLWRIFFLAIIIALVNAVVSGLLSLLSVDNADNLASSLTSLVSGPLTVAYLVEMYRDLRSAKGEMGSKSLYTGLAVLGVLGVIGLFTTLYTMSRAMSGTFQDQWQRALEQSVETGSYENSWSWSYGNGVDTNSYPFNSVDAE